MIPVTGLNIIAAHLLGDYIIQNDWMAKGKKGGWWPLTVHIVTYMIPFVFLEISWLQLSLIAIEHAIQDYTHIIPWYMQHAGKKDFSKPPMAPWSFIAVDNSFHIVSIALILHFVP